MDEIFYLGKTSFKVCKSNNDRYYLKSNNLVRPEIIVGIPQQYIMEFANLIETQTCKEVPTFSNLKDFDFYKSCLRGLYNFKGFKILSSEEKQNYIFNLVTYYQRDRCNIPEDLTLSGSFVWINTTQGQDYWQKISCKIHEYENQLQNTGIDRSRDNRSERNRLRGGGDIVEPSTRYSGYQARARKRKNAFGSHKVYLSSRCGCVHRG